MGSFVSGMIKAALGFTPLPPSAPSRALLCADLYARQRLQRSGTQARNSHTRDRKMETLKPINNKARPGGLECVASSGAARLRYNKPKENDDSSFKFSAFAIVS